MKVDMTGGSDAGGFGSGIAARGCKLEEILRVRKGEEVEANWANSIDSFGEGGDIIVGGIGSAARLDGGGIGSEGLLGGVVGGE